MVIFWILLGVVMSSAGWFVFLKCNNAMALSTWILTIGSILWGGFTLAWIVSSIAENEMQAAGMGLLVFGAILVCLILLTIKQYKVKKRIIDNSIPKAPFA